VHTFGGFAVLSALALFGLGIYLIADQLAHPVEAHDAALLFAALLISGALALSYGLLHEAARNLPRTIAPPTSITRPRPEIVIPSARRRTLAWDQQRKDLSFHGRYVDHARIRP